MQIFVQTLTNRTITVNVGPFDVVGTVKREIESRDGQVVISDLSGRHHFIAAHSLPEDEQRLIFAGKQLEDRLSFDYYNIYSGSTVHLLSRLRGGRYPEYIIAKAQRLTGNETIESLYYPLYDKILNYWFPASEDFDVVPQWTIPGTTKSTDFSVAFVVTYQDRPILLVEIKPPSAFQLESGRMEAIGQILGRLDEVGPTNTVFERLYAISEIGKRWRATYAPKSSGSNGGGSVAIPGSANSLRGAEEGCWATDITSGVSYSAMKVIVDDIKTSLQR